jgi:hypothetical protein
MGGRGGDGGAYSLGGAGGPGQGGGLYVNGGSLTVDTTTITSNHGTGGAGGLNGGVGPGAGGGLYIVSNIGTPTVTGSILSGNSAISGPYSYGGGVYTAGLLRISNSTLSGNTATSVFSYAYGGGIYNWGTLTVIDSILSSNSSVPFEGDVGYGGGIYNNDTLTVSNSTLSRNFASYGGGIYNNQTLTLSNSTLSGNSASYGGGIENVGTLMVSYSTLSGNSASYGSGGGIYDSGTLTVINSTLSGNFAGLGGSGGGIYTEEFASRLTLTNVTLTDNRALLFGGGLYSSAGFLHNTLIAGNFRGATGTTRDDVWGRVDPSSDYNLIGDGTGMTGVSNGVNGNLVGSADDPIDPLLGPLAGNGGPTFTHALWSGSQAIDAGDPNQLGTTDQRGVIRSGGVNIGAYQASASAFVLTAPDTVSSGVPFDVTVMAVDPFGQVAVGYLGTITFSSSDPDAGVVLPADYAFQLSDAGQVTFPGGVTLISPGDQTLTVIDTADKTLTGSAVVTVSSPASGARPHQRGQPPPSKSEISAAADPVPTQRELSGAEVLTWDAWFASLSEGIEAWVPVVLLRDQVGGWSG